MSKEEIKEGMEKISGGTDTKQGKKPGIKVPLLKYGGPLINKPMLLYGAPGFKPIKPVETEEPGQSAEPLTPANPVKPEESETEK